MRSLGLFHLIHPLLSIHVALAITIPIRGFFPDSTHLSKRNNLTGISITNGGNIIYGASINLGGNNFSVVLDTGRHVHPRSFAFFFYSPNLSADLWVAGSVSSTQNTGKSVSVAYAVGNVQGTDGFPYGGYQTKAVL